MRDEFNPTDWITTTEAAGLAGYSPVTLRQLAREGRITACKMGRDWLLRKEAVLLYVEELEKTGASWGFCIGWGGYFF
jgi:excisionase family DNA binding protein